MISVFMFLAGALTFLATALCVVVGIAYTAQSDVKMVEDYDNTARKICRSFRLGVFFLLLLSWILAKPDQLANLFSIFSIYIWVWVFLGVGMCGLLIINLIKKANPKFIKAYASYATWNIFFGATMAILCWLAGG